MDAALLESDEGARSQPTEPGWTINIDTGGTFTDGYLSSGAETVSIKVDTTPHDLTVGVLDCIDAAAHDLGLTRETLLRRTSVVRLSTTVGTNTLIARVGPRVGMLLGRAALAAAGTVPEPLPIQDDLVALIPDVPAPDVEREILDAVHALLEHGARVIIVVLDGGEDLATRELAIRELVARDFPRHYLGAVPVLPSHQVTLCADVRTRLATTVMDAYLHPVMRGFLYRVEDELRRSGYAHPLLIANADGGTSRVAKTTALRTWGSGPAGGVAAAARFASLLDLPAAVTVDVGGTSSDISLVADGNWRYSVEPTIEGVTVSLPVLELDSIGVGGGSIVRVIDGAIQVGPDSAGAQPGPASFGLGGERATVTDAAAAMGLLDADHFLGGRKRLDVAAGRRVIDAEVARPLGLSVEVAAARVLQAAASQVGSMLTDWLDARGVPARDAVLFATGGGGGMLAAEMMRAGGLGEARVFPLSPVFSAFGLAGLGLRHAYEARPAAADDVYAQLESLRAHAMADMRGEGVRADRVVVGVEIERVCSDGTVEPVVLDPQIGLQGAATRIGEERDQIRLVRLRAVVPSQPDEPAWRPTGAAAPAAPRLVTWNDVPVATPVHRWSGLESGAQLSGPCIVESDETTVAVPAWAVARVGRFGELIIRAAQGGSA